MKIFYATTEKQDNDELSLITRLVGTYLQSLNHELYVYAYDPSKIENLSTFQRLNTLISEADVYIGEMSSPSQSLGFQISYALSLSKPCLYLYLDNRKGEPDAFISKNPSRLLKIKTYNKDNYRRVLDKFLASAEKQLPSKRTSFMSTVQIDEFIAYKAQSSGISKGEAIRQIITEAAKDNKK